MIMFRYWKKVDAGDFGVYSTKVLEYFQKVYLPKKVIDKWSNPFWNPVPLNDVEMYFPELISSTSHFGQIKEVSTLSLTADSSTLHIDHTIGKNAGVMARLNIPILNCEGSYTAFFDMSPEEFNKHQETPGGTKYWPNEMRNTLKPTTSVELIQPTILRTSSPHTVFCKTNKFPRISLTISFKDDIIRFLDEQKNYV